MHITASVFINDDEGGLHRDYARWLGEMAPHEPISRYLHSRTGEDNGDAHLKRQVMGREVVVAVTGGKFDFGERRRRDFPNLSQGCPSGEVTACGEAGGGKTGETGTPRRKPPCPVPRRPGP